MLRILTVFGLAIFAIVSGSAANYSGLCVPSMTYVSEDSILEAAAGEAFEFHQAFFRLNDAGSLIHYRDFDDFKSRNPDCCFIGATGKKGHEGTFLDKVLGKLKGFVQVRYRDGVGSTNQIYLAVTNCGRLWNGVR